jgi:hypothetical protein
VPRSPRSRSEPKPAGGVSRHTDGTNGGLSPGKNDARIRGARRSTDRGPRVRVRSSWRAFCVLAVSEHSSRCAWRRPRLSDQGSSGSNRLNGTMGRISLLEPKCLGRCVRRCAREVLRSSRVARFRTRCDRWLGSLTVCPGPWRATTMCNCTPSGVTVARLVGGGLDVPHKLLGVVSGPMISTTCGVVPGAAVGGTGSVTSRV